MCLNVCACAFACVFDCLWMSYEYLNEYCIYIYVYYIIMHPWTVWYTMYQLIYIYIIRIKYYLCCIIIYFSFTTIDEVLTSYMILYVALEYIYVCVRYFKILKYRF